MKGEIAPELVVAVIIAIVILGWGASFIIEGQVEGSSSGGFQYVECNYNDDCPGNQLCLSVDNSEYFCGCLEDNNCFDDQRCVNNECE